MQKIPEWRKIQRQNFTDWAKLLDFLELDPATYGPRVIEPAKFPLNLPVRLAEKVEKGVWDDPILVQFLPTVEEQKPHALFQLDPVADSSFCKSSKLLHKYEGRALLICTGACAMHCRFCFRQNYDYETEEKSFEKELDLIAQDTSLSEILLSGGDPLSLSDSRLQALLSSLSEIPHIKRIRFHTRFPIGIPERIDASFLSLLEKCPTQIFFMIHCNHKRECDTDVLNSLKNIQRLGIPVLSQTVLLKNVNDTLSSLKGLFEILVDNGIIPYYLHQLDRVQGASHFEVPEEKGRLLIQQLAAQLPGYGVPKYVREIPNRPGKSPLC